MSGITGSGNGLRNQQGIIEIDCGKCPKCMAELTALVAFQVVPGGLSVRIVNRAVEQPSPLAAQVLKNQEKARGQK